MAETIVMAEIFIVSRRNRDSETDNGKARIAPELERAMTLMERIRTRRRLAMLLYNKVLLEVSEQDAAALEFMQDKCRGPYNWLVMRPRHAFFTLCYPALYIKVDGNTVLLPTGGKSKHTKRFPTIRARLTEEVPPGYKEVAISRDARALPCVLRVSSAGKVPAARASHSV